jgi:hypothetical protein
VGRALTGTGFNFNLSIKISVATSSGLGGVYKVPNSRKFKLMPVLVDLNILLKVLSRNVSDLYCQWLVSGWEFFLIHFQVSYY